MLRQLICALALVAFVGVVVGLQNISLHNIYYTFVSMIFAGGRCWNHLLGKFINKTMLI